MIRIEPFDAAHLEALELQVMQERELTALKALSVTGEAAAALGPTFTVFEGDRVLMIAGLSQVRDDYATAWALFADHKGSQLLQIVRAITRVLETAEYTRIDTLVADDFAKGHVLAKLLGFDKEGVLHAYGAGGLDFAIYARVRKGGA